MQVSAEFLLMGGAQLAGTVTAFWKSRAATKSEIADLRAELAVLSEKLRPLTENGVVGAIHETRELVVAQDGRMGAIERLCEERHRHKG